MLAGLEGPLWNLGTGFIALLFLTEEAVVVVVTVVVFFRI